MPIDFPETTPRDIGEMTIPMKLQRVPNKFRIEVNGSIYAEPNVKLYPEYLAGMLRDAFGAYLCEDVEYVITRRNGYKASAVSPRGRVIRYIYW